MVVWYTIAFTAARNSSVILILKKILLYALTAWHQNSRTPVIVMIVNPTRVQGSTELDIFEIGWFFMNLPVNRRSIQSRVPTDNESPSTCVPSTIGNIQMDSRKLVPNSVFWRYWQISKSDIMGNL